MPLAAAPLPLAAVRALVSDLLDRLALLAALQHAHGVTADAAAFLGLTVPNFCRLRRRLLAGTPHLALAVKPSVAAALGDAARSRAAVKPPSPRRSARAGARDSLPRRRR